MTGSKKGERGRRLGRAFAADRGTSYASYFVVPEKIAVATRSVGLRSESDAPDGRARIVARSGRGAVELATGGRVWSAGRCLDHLCLTNEAYLPPMALALEGKAKAPVTEVMPGWFGGRRWSCDLCLRLFSYIHDCKS